MLTPRTSISNLHQTLAVPGAQDTQTTQRASVEGVTAGNQGPIEFQQMPGHYPTTPEAAPTPFTPSAKLVERADKLRETMHVQGATVSDAQKKAHILEKAIIHGKYLEECTKHAAANNSLHTLPRFPEIEAALGFDNPLFDQVDNSLMQAQKELETAVQLRGGERGSAPASTVNLKEQMKQQAALFDEHLQNFETARKQNLSKQDREAVLKSELSFSLYAAQTTSTIPSTITSMRDTANLVIGELEEKLNAAGTESAAENERVSSLLGEWREASTALDQTLADLVPELETAVERSKIAETIKDLQDSGGWGAQLHAMVGQGFRQFGLSGFALGLVNSYSSDLLSKTPLPAPLQMALGAGLTALAHDFGTHAIAAGILELMGGATKPVKASDVTSTANKFIYDNGEFREKTTDEIQAQRELQTKFEKELKYGDNANKLGTGWSELKYASVFGAVQGLGSLVATGPAASVTGSLIAGGLVGALIGGGGMNASAKEPGGRSVPAMEPTPTSGTLRGAKNKAFEMMNKKMDYSNDDNLKTLQNKFAGLLTGSAAKRLVDFAATAIETRYPAAGKGVQAAGTAVGTVMNLLSLYGSLKISDEANAYKKEREEARTPAGQETREGYFNFDRPKGLVMLGTNPNHPAAKQVFPEGSIGRVATNVLDASQRALNLPGAVANSVVDGVVRAGVDKTVQGVRNARNTTAQPDTERDAPDNA